MRIVIAEDLVLLRDGLVRLLHAHGHEVVAAVGDGPSLVEAIEEHRPDIAIVDVRLPPSQRDEGLRAALEARARVPGTPVLVLSQYVEESYAAELLADGTGAVGYLLKDRVADPSDFVAQVDRVAAGGTAIDQEVVSQLLARRRADDPLQELTPREREVLELMAQGLSNAAIAQKLVVTDGAVEKHVTNIFGKLGVHTAAGGNLRVLAVLAWLRAESGTTP
ncbi:MAG TPA: response regulator transcription factor [Baekduia sp.]|uniref:response regulator transcription factor n=1 Tax=Baekduia sp. TaxID=2600305 RepID=UPI002D77AA20|nr:response regulator transcription factor [Baekduia sp.]HET6506576.1 response regulator transcription factor [Baekduia sp.]